MLTSGRPNGLAGPSVTGSSDSRSWVLNTARPLPLPVPLLPTLVSTVDVRSRLDNKHWPAVDAGHANEYRGGLGPPVRNA